MTAINYTSGRFDQTYVPKYVKLVTVPAHEKAPEDFAKQHFVDAFGLSNR